MIPRTLQPVIVMQHHCIKHSACITLCIPRLRNEQWNARVMSLGMFESWKSGGLQSAVWRCLGLLYPYHGQYKASSGNVPNLGHLILGAPLGGSRLLGCSRERNGPRLTHLTP